MKQYRDLLLFGGSIALLALILEYLEYLYWVRSVSTEVYLGVIAFIFMILGIWLGLRWTRPKKTSGEGVQVNPEETASLSPREIEVLKLIAEGYSNQEIADQLFVSLSTIKSHVSNLFAKLDVKRRTQAVQKAKELRILIGEEQ